VYRLQTTEQVEYNEQVSLSLSGWLNVLGSWCCGVFKDRIDVTMNMSRCRFKWPM